MSVRANSEISQSELDHAFGATSRFRLLIAAAVVCGVLLRVGLMLTYANLGNPQLWEYGEIGRNLVTTGVHSYRIPGVPSAFMPPAYSFMLASFYSILGIGLSAHVAIAIILLGCQIASAVLAWKIAGRIWSRQAGIAALVLSLLWPNFLIMSGRLHPVPISAALLLLACFVLFLEKVRLHRRAILCGICLGAYANFRSEGLVFLLPVIYYLLRVHQPEGRQWLKRGLAVLALTVAFSGMMAPWLVRNYIVFGRLVTSTSGGYNLLRGHHDNATGTGRNPWPSAASNPDAQTPVPANETIRSLTYESVEDELVADDWRYAEAVSWTRQNPGREVVLAVKKAFYFLVADFTHPVARLWPIWVPSVLALSVGLFHFVRYGGKDLRQQILWMVFGLKLLMSIVFFVLPRYRMTVDFVPVIFFAAWCARYPLRKFLALEVGTAKNHESRLQPSIVTPEEGKAD